MSANALALVDFAVGAGFDEDRVLTLFDQYVSLYTDGDSKEMEEAMEVHGPQFMEFIQQNNAQTASPKARASSKSAAKGTSSTLETPGLRHA